MKPLRVALSGSGFRVPAHVGALAAIEDAGYMPIQLAATSGGAICAALYAAGMTPADLKDLCLDLDWSPMMGPSIGSILRGRGWSNGRKLLDFLYAQTKGLSFAQIAEEGLDLRIIAADLADEQEYVFEAHRTPYVGIGFAARASASIPGVYEPVQFSDYLLQDGGLCDNLPAGHLTPDDVPRIGIYLDSRPESIGPGRRIWDLAPRIIDLMLASNESTHIQMDQHTGARIVRVNTGDASSFDRNMPRELRERLHDEGYRATAQELRLLPGWV